MHAHLLYYASLLEDFRASVEFVLNTPNPAMESDRIDDTERENSRMLLTKECNNLLSAIKRLEMNRGMLDKRSKNAMDLVSVTWILLECTGFTTREGVCEYQHRRQQSDETALVYYDDIFARCIFGRKYFYTLV
jgi:hypothetical protein